MDKRKELVNMLYNSLGAVFMAAGVAFFLLPAKIATGGTPGLGMLVHFLVDIPTGISMLLINIPLLVAGIKFIDTPFAIRTVYTMILTSVLVDVFSYFIHFPPIKSLLLSTLYGGTAAGIGVGLVLKGNASAGGTTIIARIVSSYSHIKPAQVVMFIDALIVLTIGLLFKDMERMLWSMLSIYATTRMIDKVLTGAVPEKIVHIASSKAESIGKRINLELGRDGSILSGHNLTHHHEKQLLFVLVDARRIPRLKSIVIETDPSATMIVMEAKEMIAPKPV